MCFFAFYTVLSTPTARSFRQRHGLLERCLNLLDILPIADYSIPFVQIVIYFPGYPALLGVLLQTDVSLLLAVDQERAHDCLELFDSDLLFFLDGFLNLFHLLVLVMVVAGTEGVRCVVIVVFLPLFSCDLFGI